ncbi:MAG TPA: protease pro-enzyme activation domain-containing protein, partial [Pseudacidobacterium sp.]|nr:protease pro-enzyme activation domain-containing protein [Pseudacidobacterium sp.]
MFSKSLSLKPRTVAPRLAALAAAGLFAFTASTSFAQTQQETVIPNRITQAINPDVRVTLQHNVHPLAQARFDQGAAPGSMSTGRIMLVLKRSDAQETALKQFLSDVQTPSSPNYRKWLTPAQFGKQYGISDTDLSAVTAWLQSQGFTVDKVPQARNVVIFSGNVAQIQQAFHTSIHRYNVNGESHFANASDPQIPAALAPVVGGIASLNDFHPKSNAARKSTAHFDPETKSIKPDLTLSDTSGNHYLYVGPADAATIYDTPSSALNGNYSSSLLGGKTYDGTGVTIGIVGDSNINASDVAAYRAGFLPSTYTNQPNVIIDGNDPGINGDATEALLDLEVSGGIAPGANINFYTAADTDLQVGLFLSIYRALDDNAVSILNVSFGNCEASQGASGNLQILNAWEQAAAQGISVTVSTGDSGSAGCDDPNTETVATMGLAISGLASTPYNIAVGGTDYNALATSFSTYVSTTNSASTFYRTALKYIPENPWNDSPLTNSGSYTTNMPFKDSQ